MLLKTKPWLVGCTMLQVWFHPMCWRLSYTKPAPAGREVCAKLDSAYWYISVGPFTVCGRYLQ